MPVSFCNCIGEPHSITNLILPWIFFFQVYRAYCFMLLLNLSVCMVAALKKSYQNFSKENVHDHHSHIVSFVLLVLIIRLVCGLLPAEAIITPFPFGFIYQIFVFIFVFPKYIFLLIWKSRTWPLTRHIHRSYKELNYSNVRTNN